MAGVLALDVGHHLRDGFLAVSNGEGLQTLKCPRIAVPKWKGRMDSALKRLGRAVRFLSTDAIWNRRCGTVLISRPLQVAPVAA